ncbi:hypothetical protein [Litorisediminicola beolgyonensis]|uniref:Lysozyme inhibitor LprI N-terminal domain-containing protein n=1 Tax=Litorisediminicola beolgyonensis TaxID=1173614 RepID=A0ABW3ZIC7_9RHOB
MKSALIYSAAFWLSLGTANAEEKPSEADFLHSTFEAYISYSADLKACNPTYQPPEREIRELAYKIANYKMRHEIKFSYKDEIVYRKTLWRQGLEQLNSEVERWKKGCTSPGRDSPEGLLHIARQYADLIRLISKQ